MAVVYRHIRLDTGMPFYVGIGLNIKRAFSNRNRNKEWKKIAEDCGYEVEILFEDLDYNKAIEKEKEFIKLYGRLNLSSGFLVNLTDGGEGFIGYKPSKETLCKIGQKSKGRIKTPQQIEKWRKSMTFIVTDEVKKKISDKLKGTKHTKERVENIRKSHLGKKLSEEAKKKLSEYWTGRKRGAFTEEHKRKLSEAKLGKKYNKIKEHEFQEQ